MESIIKDSPTKTRRKFDKSFKCEVVRNWLSSGKSAAVIAKELGLNESLLFDLRKLLPPAEAGGKAAAGSPARLRRMPRRRSIFIASYKQSALQPD